MFVYCHNSAKHDYKYLASLAIRTKIAIGKKLANSKGTKRQRANTIRKALEK
jgi:hypothetical protein